MDNIAWLKKDYVPVGELKRGIALQVADDVYDREINGYTMPRWTKIEKLYNAGKFT